MIMIKNFEWINYGTVILLTIVLILTILYRHKTVRKIRILEEVLYQTFNNVEVLKARWKECKVDIKYGRIGQIFAKRNEAAGLNDIIRTVYEKREIK